MNTHEAIVKVRGLTKTYGDVQALAGIDFDIYRGEVFSLLGPNGAGKSTAIEILEGYRRRSGGTAQVLGEDPEHATRAWRARVGIVLQSAGLPDEMTVRELVAHFSRFYLTPRNTDEVIEHVGLTAKSRARIGTLSGGQKRRLDVALGIIGRPELLFLDEPTTGFDPEARHHFWDLIRHLRDEGTTILLTTHYLDEAAQLSDRAAVVTNGRIVAEGAINGIGGTDARTPVVRWIDDDGPHEVRTSRPTALVANLSARNNSGEVPHLEIVRPSLEDIYLDIVGAAK
ncbi:MAG: ABC transporter ATP-binding protein [Ancrocorticia sp.]